MPCPNDSVHILEVIYSCIKSSIIDSIEPIGVSNKTSSQSNKRLETTTTTTTITSTETTKTTTTTTITTTTIHPYLNRSLEVDNFDEEDYIDMEETSDEYQTIASNRTSEYDEEEELLPITCRTRMDNTEFSAHLGDYINLQCSSAAASSNAAYLSQPLLSSHKHDVKPEYEIVSGFMLYECRADGNFYFINSTCTKRKPLQQQQ